ncbi:MAG: DNA methylase [Chryseobacterium sp. SCN 40-13]|nr:MAG: DNA methylase [Chryseobacterium sp. SCN 40-13]
MDKKELTNIDGTLICYRNLGILPANKNLRERAKSLRKAGVLSEVIFWLQVRNKSFYGLDFDRQRIIGNYIVDFYLKSLGIAIEIDGSSHDDKEEYDAERQQYLESLGIIVYRISDTRVKHDCANVIQELKEFIVKEFSETPLS